MSVDPRAPVIVGVGQAQQRPDDPQAALEPIDLLARAAESAFDDSGAAGTLRAAADTAAVVQIVSWPYADPGALLGRRLGLENLRRTIVTTVGGNSPQMLVSELAAEIARGDADVVLLGGAECVYTRWRARREPKVWLEWTQADDPPCPRVVGDDRPGSSDYEMAHMAAAPTQVYPLLETALRSSAGHSIDEHQVCVSELWSTFAQVAARNPHAWSRAAYSPEDIRAVRAENRMVAFPYPKLMCANIDVDQAAASVLCSYERARAAGVSDDRLVFPLASADAHDHFYFSERDRLDTSPAIRAAAQAMLRAAGLDIEGVDRFDLYSCFPAAVQIAMGALGLAGPAGGDDRPLTVTGGLGFAGGPANNYPSHAIAAMVDACRRDPGSIGYVGALGWYCTKHSMGLYSTEPPRGGFARVDRAVPQAEVDALPSRETAGAYDGEAILEAMTVVVDRDGTPTVAVVSALTPEGARALANSRERDVMSSMMEEPWEGKKIRVTTDGATNELRPCET